MKYPNGVGNTIKQGYKLVNFLLNRYCFNMGMPLEKWIRMLKHFAQSKEMFPINDEFCYGRGGY